MEYQETVTVPTVEEMTTEKSTTVPEKITAQHWTPIFSSTPLTTASPPPDTIENIYEQHKELKDEEHKTDVRDTKEIAITNTTFQALVKDDTKEICPHFRFGKQHFDLEPMADVWQTAFFSLPDNIQCFKILIKRLTDKVRTLTLIFYIRQCSKYKILLVSINIYS